MSSQNCVTCPESPTCNCKSGETCQFSLQTCSQCAVATCVADQVSPKSNAGAIAGGVVGGLVGLCLILGLVLWYYCYKSRRAGRGPPIDGSETPDLYNSPRDSLDSYGHSRASMTTVNTTQARGSNIIPIAYIPGVSVLPREGNRGSDMPIRNSIATTNYRASVPEMMMAIHGQPSLVEVGNSGSLSGHESSATVGSLREGSINSVPGSARNSVGTPGTATAVPFYSLGRPNLSSLNNIYPAANADTIDASSNAGTSMVAIPEEGAENAPTVGRRNSSMRINRMTDSQSQRNSRAPSDSVRYSQALSTKEYMMNLPEEAYLYHANGLDFDENKESDDN